MSEVAQFIITRPDGVQYTYEGTVEALKQHLQAQPLQAEYELIHPGTSGHGQAGQDY